MYAGAYTRAKAQVKYWNECEKLLLFITFRTKIQNKNWMPCHLSADNFMP